MDQLLNVLLVIDKTQTVLHWSINGRPGFDGLSQVDGLNPLLRISVASIVNDFYG